jgi:hypothetical protein
MLEIMWIMSTNPTWRSNPRRADVSRKISSGMLVTFPTSVGYIGAGANVAPVFGREIASGMLVKFPTSVGAPGHATAAPA